MWGVMPYQSDRPAKPSQPGISDQYTEKPYRYSKFLAGIHLYALTKIKLWFLAIGKILLARKVAELGEGGSNFVLLAI